MKQTSFEYNIQPKYNIENFYVSEANEEAYEFVINENNHTDFSILYGPAKSGKTHLGLIWMEKNKAILYNQNNYFSIIKENNNIFIDDFFNNLNEEYMFYIINHCFNNNLKILLCSDRLISNYDFKLKDLSSRLKSFYVKKINKPDDDLIVNLLTKLLYDKQIIINNPDIFSFILNRINRTYEDVHKFIEKIDKFSLEKKRELTIPLIKKLI